MRQTALAAAVVLFFAALGCKKSGAPSSGGAPPPAEELVPRARETIDLFFRAATANDCDTLLRIRAKPMSAEDCEHYVHHFNGKGTKLLRIADARVDGRDPSVVLVTVKLLFGTTGSNEHQWVMRVPSKAGESKVEFE